MIHYGESVANSPLAVKHFARTLPLVAKSGKVVNHFAANFLICGEFTASGEALRKNITASGEVRRSRKSFCG